MIGRIVRLLTAAIGYTCVATVLAAVAVFVLLQRSGRLTPERSEHVLALLRGEDPAVLLRPTEMPKTAENEEQRPFSELELQRALKSRDLELRELAMQQGLKTMRYEQTKLADERERFQQVRVDFEKQLEELRAGALAAARTSVQQTLENLTAKQAKAQLLQMIESNEIQHVVSLLATMPIDKRADILNEFKTDEEVQRLAEILREMRKGNPELPLIDQTIGALQGAKPTPSP